MQSSFNQFCCLPPRCPASGSAGDIQPVDERRRSHPWLAYTSTVCRPKGPLDCAHTSTPHTHHTHHICFATHDEPKTPDGQTSSALCPAIGGRWPDYWNNLYRASAASDLIVVNDQLGNSHAGNHLRSATTAATHRVGWLYHSIWDL